jgi:predicted dehydrogenase
MSLLRGVSEGAMTRYAVRKTEPLRSELEAFVQCVRTGQGPIVRAEDALEVLGLALAMVDAARYGGVKEIRPRVVN